MKQATMKIDADLMVRIQKIKMAFYEKYHKTISLSEVIQRVFDKDPLIVTLMNNNF